MLLRLAYLTVTNTFAALRLLPLRDRDKDVEILALRHQITVLQRQLGADTRVKFAPEDRAFLGALLTSLPREVLRRLRLVVRPDTVLRRHRDATASRPYLPAGPTWAPPHDPVHPRPHPAPGSGEPRLGLSAGTW
ncbi:hypothetical protein [Nonomuraea sp. WAC 01424]|uniref:hypothetical protein n=1 Tax=Nonomuraea sp. WAC 01424 TaxID=2203200 RepID=UPI00163BA4C5|nr:hypothetical protein [Nonomuraea sp. WAC 01424]